MQEIQYILQYLSPVLDRTTINQLTTIVFAMLSMTGRVTMLGISRWTFDRGGSYRTVQRFFSTNICWLHINWYLFRHHIYDPDDVYLLAGDEVVVTKSGNETFGIDRFFSSLFNRVVKSISFFSLSLISVKDRTAYPILNKQIVRPDQEESEKSAEKEGQNNSNAGQEEAKKETEKESQNNREGKETKRKNKNNKGKQKSKKEKKKAGRPKGSKNKDKVNVNLPAHLLFIKMMITLVLNILLPGMSIQYLLLDGAFGNNNSLQMARMCGLFLISKLRADSALYFLYEGEQNKRGRKRKYGEKIDYKKIPKEYFKSHNVDLKKKILTDIYQMKMLHKEFGQVLNVVIIVKTNIVTGESRHVILFSADLELSHEKLVDYYSLRFQIEFTFRDAKQYWGLEDFMNIKEQQVHNAANLAMFMVLFSKILLKRLRPQHPNWSVLDLKAHFRSLRYVLEILKLFPKNLDPILIRQLLNNIPNLGAIHDS